MENLPFPSQEQSLYSKDDNDAYGKSGVLDEKLRHVEAERVRLALLEDKLRHLLQVLLTLADLVSGGAWVPVLSVKEQTECR